MSPQVEKLITAITTIMLGIVGVAFLTALVNKKSQTPAVTGAFTSGFACALRAAMGQGSTCGSTLTAGRINIGGAGGAGGTSVNSGVNYGCTTVDGVQYCP